MLLKGYILNYLCRNYVGLCRAHVGLTKISVKDLIPTTPEFCLFTPCFSYKMTQKQALSYMFPTHIIFIILIINSLDFAGL